MQKTVSLLLAVIAVLAMLAVPAFADPLSLGVGYVPPSAPGSGTWGPDPSIAFTVSDLANPSNAGSGTLYGNELGLTGEYQITSGNLTLNGNTYSLIPTVPSSNFPQVQTSPNSAFSYDNIVYDPNTSGPAGQFLTLAGLVFENNAGQQVNIFGNGTTTFTALHQTFVGGLYGVWTGTDEPDTTSVSNGVVNEWVFNAGSPVDFPLQGVPEPGAIVSLLGVGAMGLFGLGWRRCKSVA